MDTADTLHRGVLTLLSPVTRDRYTYTGSAKQKTEVNPQGIDVHEFDVDNPVTGANDTVDPYVVVMGGVVTGRHGRLSGGESSGLYTFTLTVVAGSPRGARDAVSDVQACFRNARLDLPDAERMSTGLVTPYFEGAEIIRDPDASPTRWQSTLRYRSSVH